MRFHQVKDLVRWAADYHASLANAYTERAADDIAERVRMAMQYLARHELRMHAELKRYLSESSEHRNVLDTWFDDPADVPQTALFEKLRESVPCDSVQSLLSAGLATHRTLHSLYTHRAEHAVSAVEREFFNALISEHESEVRRLSRDMQRLEDY